MKKFILRSITKTLTFIKKKEPVFTVALLFLLKGFDNFATQVVLKYQLAVELHCNITKQTLTKYSITFRSHNYVIRWDSVLWNNSETVKNANKLNEMIKQYKVKSNQNQIFCYTRCITSKRPTSLWGPSPRHCAWATPLFSKKCRSGGEPLAAVGPIWPARDLNSDFPVQRQTRYRLTILVSAIQTQK